MSTCTTLQKDMPAFLRRTPLSAWVGLAFAAVGGQAQAQTTNQPPAGYVFCAAEAQRCNFAGAASVVYGAGTAWTSPRSFANGVACDNVAFGDPAWGTAKSCYVNAGAGSVSVRARATLVANLGATMQLRVNGAVVGSTEVRASTATNHNFTTPPIPAGARLDVVFLNDYNANGQDRNLFVESITVNGVTLAANAPGVTFDRGTGNAAFDGVDVLPGTPALFWNGALRFTLAGAPAPAPEPEPAPTGALTYYFSDCQTGAATGCLPGSNANPGTQALPKQNLAGINLNALPAGSRLYFVRGGAWNWSRTLLENPHVTPSAPLVIDAYGGGSIRPVFNAGGSTTSAIDFGEYNNTSNDGGYTIRNIKWDGKGSTPYGFFLIHNLRNFILENNEITGFHIGIHSQSRAPDAVNNVTIRNNDIVRNSSMGILGQFKDTLIEGNLFEGNNFGGSGFDHGTYLSGSESEGMSGTNITLRNNRYIRNSVVNGVCQGGNMTFHGQMANVLIEGNRIEQDASASGCWEMSITQGYGSAEWFRSFVVRNNKLINSGNTAMNVQSAPGIVIEGNVVINTQPTYQTSINVGHTEFQGGDVPDGNAVVRNNTFCYTNPNTGSVGLRVTAPNSTVSNNVTVTGAAAATGVCAR